MARDEERTHPVQQGWKEIVKLTWKLPHHQQYTGPEGGAHHGPSFDVRMNSDSMVTLFPFTLQLSY